MPNPTTTVHFETGEGLKSVPPYTVPGRPAEPESASANVIFDGRVKSDSSNIGEVIAAERDEIIKEWTKTVCADPVPRPTGVRAELNHDTSTVEVRWDAPPEGVGIVCHELARKLPDQEWMHCGKSDGRRFLDPIAECVPFPFAYRVRAVDRDDKNSVWVETMPVAHPKARWSKGWVDAKLREIQGEPRPSPRKPAEYLRDGLLKEAQVAAVMLIELQNDRADLVYGDDRRAERKIDRRIDAILRRLRVIDNLLCGVIHALPDDAS